MDAFKTHEQVISSYREYLNSFMQIDDVRINAEVEKALKDDGFIPQPLIQFNPSFQKDISLQQLASDGIVNANLPIIFGEYNLYKHQIEAIKIGVADKKGFVVTSGTGSGKSLTYLATIFNKLLEMGADKPKGIKAILVYPMNALINSQAEEIEKFVSKYGDGKQITYAKYTGQEGTETRKKIEDNPPDIILTNYMMLELMMTRQSENWLRESIKDNLSFLVFDELHTYRGRQGADVSMLIRRITNWCKSSFVCIGTSATMASAGNPLEKKQAVANVATTIFGVTYEKEQIVGEYLDTCTAAKQFNAIQLKQAILADINTSDTEEQFVNHPIVNWLELNIALTSNEGVLERGTPKSINEIASALHSVTELPISEINFYVEKLLKWAEDLNERNRKQKTGKSYLPFRFHQFISQTSLVNVTLESRKTRTISIKPGRWVKQDGADKLMYPLLFSRYSGVDFICVEKDIENNKLIPRNPQEEVITLKEKDAKAENLTESNFRFGYIVLNEGEKFWELDPLDIAPPQWLNKSETAFKPFYHWHIPQKIYFNSLGDYSNEPIYPLEGYYMPVKLRIDPTAAVIYEDSKTNEKTKLSSIGSEGRSTATSIISYTIIDSLSQVEEVQNQKLLSFTDNRQDASLQTGHFNDFLCSVRLRSALHYALQNKPDGLNIHTISTEVFDALQLKETDYAKEPNRDTDFADEENTKALKDYLLYRILLDLKRGWRYTLPNLEQTALLSIEYKNLSKLCAMDDKFVNLELFQNRTPQEREAILTQFLSYFRTKYSLDHRYIIEQKNDTEQFLKNKLNNAKLWALDINETLEAPNYLLIDSIGRPKQRGIFFDTIGPRTIVAKFIKRKLREYGLSTFSTEEYNTFMYELCNRLADANILKEKIDLVGEKGKANGYLLRADALIWKAGNEQNVNIDYVRINAGDDLVIKPNLYFQKLYKTDFTKYQKQIVGREHTGQISSELRIEREEQFRNGEISTLFCSPTMELGIDIANLNIVHMRNVPPNPANYAQRSGRAGRSGQTALVFTYCSAMSPHDQNYFNAASTMVAGSVVPPKIDLINEELLRSHFNAFLLMQLSIGELKNSVREVLDLSNENDIKVDTNILTNIENQILNFKDTWVADFKATITSILPALNEKWWYTDNWLEDSASSFSTRFCKAFERWIALYQGARRMINRARVTIDDMVIKADSIEKKEAKVQHAIGIKQIELLVNKDNKSSSNESEFYIFRYLAAEGFLPGYNFTRLPIRTMVGTTYNGQVECISRSRSVAISEYGPRNTIYHNGNKYQMDRMNILEADNSHRKIKISKETGYAFLDGDATRANVDPITLTPLNGDEKDFITNAIEMTDCEAVPRERISCIEEERLSTGFIIEPYFRYAKGMEHTQQLVIENAGHPILNLIYNQATELITLNLGHRRAVAPNFAMDRRNGKWLSQKDMEKDPNKLANNTPICLFVKGTADTLYIQPLSNMNIEANQITSLSYALKLGIIKLFQVEENEIGVRVIGNEEKPNILIYESSEGSLGVLSQLVQNTQKLQELFIESYKAIHYDPATLQETELGKTLPKASYKDLLSYYNQREHEKLNRYDIREVLEQLMQCDLSPIKNGKNYEEQYQALLTAYDKSSGSELPLLKYLYKNKLALPDKAQVNLPDFYINADFVYNAINGPVLVFCDGQVHDTEAQKEKDTHNRNLLRNAGYDIITWHYLEKLEDLVLRRKDIFRKL